MPLRPVGNSAACQPNSRSSVSGSLIVLRGVEHHLDDALDIAIGGRQGADVHAEAARDRGADLLAIEHFAFDLARLEDVLGQRREHGLGAQRKAERFHAPDQPPLVVADGGQLLATSR